MCPIKHCIGLSHMICTQHHKKFHKIKLETCCVGTNCWIRAASNCPKIVTLAFSATWTKCCHLLTSVKQHKELIFHEIYRWKRSCIPDEVSHPASIVSNTYFGVSAVKGSERVNESFFSKLLCTDIIINYYYVLPMIVWELGDKKMTRGIPTVMNCDEGGRGGGVKSSKSPWRHMWTAPYYKRESPSPTCTERCAHMRRLIWVSYEFALRMIWDSCGTHMRNVWDFRTP
jgi:hypothetical protein